MQSTVKKLPDEHLSAKANLYHHDPRDTNLKIRLLMATGNSEDSHGTPNAALRRSLVSQQTRHRSARSERIDIDVQM